MTHPVLVEILRGPQIESFHRGSLAVVDAEGEIVFSLGDRERPIFPRSAVKALQALPLVESGAAEQWGLSEAEIALACASHIGAPEHVATASSLLAKIGCDETCLECGIHWPMSETAGRQLAAKGRKPSALHNNCSGKHAGFLCLAAFEGEDPKGYVRPDHPVQERVRATLEDLTGFSHGDDLRAVDGCSIPTYAVPLPSLALAFAKFGTGVGMSKDCAKAAATIRKAMADHPVMLAGDGRFDTRIAQILGERAVVKVGAEGVYCAAFPEAGLGVALKCDDGAIRAAEIVMASLILQYVRLEEDERVQIENLAEVKLHNWNGIETGTMKAAQL